MQEQSIGHIFDQCLALVATGVSVAACLARYPAYADELHLLLTRADEHTALYQALRGLTPEQRLVVALQCFGDRTIVQIARLIGESEATVEATQRQAVGALAAALLDCEGEARAYGA